VWLGYVNVGVSGDKVTQTELAGIAASLKDIKAGMGAIASQADIQELRAELVAQARPPLTTGSIGKLKR
jgi:hypothetical protein